MKCLLLFVLSVSALCATCTSSVHLLGNGITLSRAQTEAHKILRRQDPFSQFSECLMLIPSRNCINGLSQEGADLLQGCNESVAAQGVQANCERNSMGTYCEAAGQSHLFNVISNCVLTSPNCSSDCRNALVDARSELGCCFNALNMSASAILDYSLCNVEPVTEKCRTSTIKLRSIPIDPTCNNISLPQRLWSIVCRQRYVQDIRNALSATRGCQDYPYPGGTICHANKEGTYCFPLEEIDDFTRVSESCGDTSACNSLCTTRIRNLSDSMGCCVNSLYNNTAFGPSASWLSYEFLSRCGLESPGLCQEVLNNADTRLNASSMIIVIVLAIARMLM